MAYFKAYIDVIKSLQGWEFSRESVIIEKLIPAANKEEVKKYLVEKYPQFFPAAKVYTRETKDKTQFFYVNIYELYSYELNLIDQGEWECKSCGHIGENRYMNRPKFNKRLFGETEFCTEDCITLYIAGQFNNLRGDEIPDNINYVRKDSVNYIYKIEQKSSGKCYVGKTRNEPVFRWWDHLKKSMSPFGIYLRSTPLTDWIFEVIDVLPGTASDSDVFELESKRIREYDSINNGFNSVISKKQKSNQAELFTDPKTK